MSGICLIWLMIAVVTTWAGWKTTDDVHRIALVSMGVFCIVLFLISTPESVQLFLKFMFLMVLLLGRFVLRSSLRPQPQRYE